MSDDMEADADEIEKPEESGEWLNMIEVAQRYFDPWQGRADRIDRLYSQMASKVNANIDREFALFWSNIQVLLPAIYARPPIPVVTPKFKDRRPLYRTSSEMLERCCIVSLDLADIDSTMIALRDDLAIVGRGAAWVRYEDGEDGESVCYEYVDREDFLHDPARRWCDVAWVARRGWLTKAQMTKRFSADKAERADYSTRRDDNERGPSSDHVEKCGVWEIWHKPSNRVVWVCQGLDEVLESADPHLKLSGFFPCPQPVYATTERRSLIPVPDIVYYQDQLSEINDLTARMHALGRALVLKGFYLGGGEIGEAVEAAMNLNDDGKIMVPVSSMAALGAAGGEPIIWLPIEQVANTIMACGELRRQLIEDVYQIIGLSDIMRGQVNADEKLGQSQIKQQNGAARVRDKQESLVRVARDLVRLGAEIMAEKFDKDTLIEMSQMELLTDADVKRQVADLEEQAEAELEGMAEQAKAQMEQGQQQLAMAEKQMQPEQFEQARAQAAQQAQQGAQQFQQAQQEAIQKWGMQIQQAGQQVTIEQVMDFLEDQKLRPFVLDIETDSTIYPDEAREKASRAEFVGAFTQAMAGLMPLMQLGPEAINLVAGMVKFSLAPYRVGRELEGLIDDFADQGPQMAQQLQAQAQSGESDEMAKANMALAQAEMLKAQASAAKVQADTQGKMQEIQLKAAEAQAKAQADQQKMALEAEKTRGTLAETEARIRKIEAEIAKLDVDAVNQTRTQDRDDVKLALDEQNRQQDQALKAAGHVQQVTESERSNARADRGEDRADRQQDFSERGGE